MTARFYTSVFHKKIYLIISIMLFSGCEKEEISGSDLPNVVIVLADDLGYSDIGAYGSEISTPNLDQLAQGGIRFTQMHNTSKCFPSRAALLTGLYAQQVNMHRSPGEFKNGLMFGEVLKKAGYRTLFVGKHHGTDNPFDWGFDHYFGMRDGGGNYFNPGLQREGEEMPAQKRYGKRVFAFDDKIVQPYTPAADYYATDTWTDWALELLGKYEEEDDPFLLYLSYQAPHDPLQAPEASIDKYDGVYNKGYGEIALARYEKQRSSGLLDEKYPRSPPTYPDWESLSDSLKQDEVRRMQVYAGMIDRLDENIGRIIDYLKQKGEWENTLFMFMSDNGASAEVVELGTGSIGSMTRWASLKENWANVANTPFRYYKNTSYEGGTATPFIVHWPKEIPKGGEVNHTLLHFIDIMPTLIEIGEAEYPGDYKGEKIHPLEGESILPVFKGKFFERKKPLYFEWRRGSAVRNEQWKLVRERKEGKSEDSWELYDMTADRTETTNLIEKHTAIADTLRIKWEKWAEQVEVQ